MPTHFIDSHAHLSSSELMPESEALIKAAQTVGVTCIINICTDEKTLQDGLFLAKQHLCIKNVAATTPHDVEKEGESFFQSVVDAAHEGNLVAIGETGLDYYHEHSPKNIQKHFFTRYIDLSIQTNLPLVIHCRDAFPDFFSMISKNARGVLHCFTGTLEDAEELVRRSWFVSFSGIVTFKKSQELQKVAASIPLENLLIETDSPYLAPNPYRGKVNQPAFVIETARTIAALRGLDTATLAAATTENAKRLFRI